MQNIAPQPKVTQANNPLHGVKLQMIVEQLHEKYGWDGLAYRINIKCFKSDPSVKSSLKFLRRTPWAREKVERLYLKTFHKKYRPESY
ncbi:VF530 family DNA-binding protein [Glaciecola sp.]|uniref:VF530 family protein n=1 Tax=Glaciecola sp. MF2-115 TaxID=3384827 RepID=UPI0039893561